MFAVVECRSRIPSHPRIQRPEDWLADALDTHLLMEPRVIHFGPDPQANGGLRSALAPHGSVVRIARLADRTVTVIAVPGEASGYAASRRNLIKLWGTRDVFIVREAWLLREPRLGVLSAIAACKDRCISVTDWLRVERHLIERGGSSCLEACACEVHEKEDPAGAVLALVAAGWLRIDTSRPLSGHSEIALRTRRRCGRLLIGG